ncbi:hypothetical protein [Streptomyces sp. NBC_00203]|uniref:hypothetical protein n=1 Tax=Streptomyces sp. NBC_00203 TaxID=2975680 RepID=UPI0032563110
MPTGWWPPCARVSGEADDVQGHIEVEERRQGERAVNVGEAQAAAAARCPRGPASDPAATDSKPKLSYPVGSAAARVGGLRRSVPARTFDKSVRKLNRMTG